MHPDEIAQVESLISQFPSIPAFFGSWLSKEIGKARKSQSHHIFLAYLASPYGYVFAEKTGRIFETILRLIPGQCQRLKKKVIETVEQGDLEAVLFELEIVSLLLKHGQTIEVEPLGRKRKGPDLKTEISGYDIYIEAKKLQRDAETERLWRTGHLDRTHTESDLNEREWDLYERYLTTSQFPDEGLHVLIMDTSKHARADRLMSRAWQYYSTSSKQEDLHRPLIHTLILCRRRKQNHISWLNDLTAGAVILQNTHSPVPKNVLGILTGVFQ